MRLGKVRVLSEYVVDLDDENMVSSAKISLYEDLMNAVKFDELEAWIEVVEAPEANESDIPGFLKDEEKHLAEEEL
jgi:hypothetical protein